MTSEAAQSLQTGRVDIACGRVCCMRGATIPNGRWKEETGMEETGAVSDRAPHVAYSLHPHASRRARTEKMSAA
jgi:hypothetical protein